MINMEGKLFECDGCRHFSSEEICQRRKQDLSCYEEQFPTVSSIFVQYINEHTGGCGLDYDKLKEIANNYGLYVRRACANDIVPLDFEGWCEEMKRITNV